MNVIFMDDSYQIRFSPTLEYFDPSTELLRLQLLEHCGELHFTLTNENRATPQSITAKIIDRLYRCLHRKEYILEQIFETINSPSLFEAIILEQLKEKLRIRAASPTSTLFIKHGAVLQENPRLLFLATKIKREI